MRTVAEKLNIYSSKELNIKKFQEIAERKSKECEKLNNDVKILSVKMQEKEKRIEKLKEESLKLFEKMTKEQKENK